MVAFGVGHANWLLRLRWLTSTMVMIVCPPTSRLLTAMLPARHRCLAEAKLGVTCWLLPRSRPYSPLSQFTVANIPLD